MEEFVYWNHPTAPGIKVAEVSGGTGAPAKAWESMARQIFCENGADGWCEIIHSDEGAPLMENSDQRISVTHTRGLLAVAMLPPVREADLTQFSLRTAMGIDAEREDRDQAARLRERFLSDDECAMISADDIPGNILAWTVKEAVFKAMLSQGVEFRRDIIIKSLPEVAAMPLDDATRGKAVGVRRNGDTEERVEFDLFSYRSEGCIVTLAYSPKCALYSPLRKRK